MRVLLVTRIFPPEIAAAAFRLRALCAAGARRGDHVTVLTSRPPAALDDSAVDLDGMDVRRWPVARDRNGQVRGYLQYASFDAGAILRVAVARRPDLIVTEPPPTTAWLVSLIARLRRIPHVYYSADCWSDAVRAAGASPLVARIVLFLERGAMRRSTAVVTVNAAIASRLRELHPGSTVVDVGNGVDTQVFRFHADSSPDGHPSVLYAGTVSEWQGAGILLAAWERVHARRPDARLVVVGSGSDWDALHSESQHPRFGGSVDVIPAEAPATVARRFAVAHVSVVTLTPGIGYDYAVPTKLMASLCAGTPVVFAGDGAAEAVMASIPTDLAGGRRVAHEASALADGLLAELSRPRSGRQELSQWAVGRFSLDAVAERAVSEIHRVLGGSR